MYIIFEDYSHLYTEHSNPYSVAMEEAARRGVRILRLVKEL